MGTFHFTMLRITVLLALSAAGVYSNSPGEGLCLSSGDVAVVCTAGTDVGAKLASALATCSGAAGESLAGRALERRGKGKGKGKGKGNGKGKGKGKGKKCPTLDE